MRVVSGSGLPIPRPSRASQAGAVPARLGHYRILEKIGEGGMGAVYRAHDERLDRDVAVKLLPAGAIADERARRRFQKEALALSKLNHPNIETIFDFDRDDELDFIVTEYIPGEGLDEKLRHGPLPEREVVRLGAQLAEGLAAAHEQSIIHRDLKPSNLHITHDGRLKILDFGIAKLMLPVNHHAATASASESTRFAGTLPYMSPQQVRGEKLDWRTDIWAAGVVLYQMTVGHRPFPATGLDVADQILHNAPVPPSRLNPELSIALDVVVMKCLDKDPDERYQSARDLAVDLRHVLASSTATLHRPEPCALSHAPHVDEMLVTQARPLHRRAWQIALAVVIGVLLAGAGWYWAARKLGRQTGVGPRTPSVAVLPFVDLSPDKDQEYFSDGLAEELLNALAKIPELHVTGRTSSFQFKGKNEDLRTIGQKLKVATVLEGSVRKQGKQVRITAQLINVSDGYHLFSQTYDADLNDIFSVQEEIARSVAASLKTVLLSGKIGSPRTTHPEAYTAYLQAQYFHRRHTRESVEEAVRLYRRSVELDPNYAPAWQGLAAAYTFQAGTSAIPLHTGFQQAREAAERALALNPKSGVAYATLGDIKRIYDWDWAGAEACFERALALEPGNPAVLQTAAQLAATLNHFEEALRLDRRAIELDPLRASTYHALAFHAWWAGRVSDSTDALTMALKLNPEFPWVHMLRSRIFLVQSDPGKALAEAELDPAPIFRLQGLALSYHALGRRSDADHALNELIAKYGGESAFQIAEVYAFRGQADRAFEWLDRAYAQRDSGLIEMKGDPLLKNLESDRRYPEFLNKMRLPG